MSGNLQTHLMTFDERLRTNSSYGKLGVLSARFLPLVPATSGARLPRNTTERTTVHGRRKQPRAKVKVAKG